MKKKAARRSKKLDVGWKHKRARDSALNPSAPDAEESIVTKTIRHLRVLRIVYDLIRLIPRDVLIKGGDIIKEVFLRRVYHIFEASAQAFKELIEALVLLIGG